MKKDKNQVPEGTVSGATVAPVKKKKKRKKAPIIITVIVVVLVVIWVASCAFAPKATALVTTTGATRGELQESISTSGKVVSEETKVLFAPVDGTIASVEVAAGDAVAAGDVLISYDMEDMEKMLTQAALQQKKSNAGYSGLMAENSLNQAKLNEANTNLDVLNQQIEDNKSYLKTLQEKLEKSQRDTSNGLASDGYNLTSRLGQLQNELKELDPSSQEYADKAAQIQDVDAQITRNQYLQSVASSSDYVSAMQKEIAEVQEKIADYEQYKARMESQKAASEGSVLDSYDKTQYAADQELAEMSYQGAEADYTLAKEGVCAAFNGIITECSVVEGAPVAEGTKLLTLESSDKIKISLYASKQDIEKLEVGQKANITISGNTYEGQVQKINRMATLNESNTPMVGVEVHITNPDDKIILGMDAKLEILTRRAEDALLIPVEAVNADRDGDFLYVVENGVIVRKPVVCGISSDNYTEIKEGITEEDQIVLTAYTDIQEGMAVTVMPQVGETGADEKNDPANIEVTVN